MVFKSQDLILNFDRLRSSATDFIRGNPLISAGVALGAPLVVVGATAGIRGIRKRRKKKSAKRKKPVKRRKTRSKTKKRKRKSVTHRSPRHKGHRMVTFTTKDGKRVRFKVKKPAHSHKIKRRRK